ncbi:TPA: hypothetical protein R5B65_000029 [Campylobacter jejuni]|uniref:hypothetical protein n=1 Tax=Campylobacter jejuni TaxID=197 RepID=UPI0012F375A5|nr:hypothetical protein [Campylobacter jejuni]ECQ5853181.1 hypothetical protein [Campylobacter jejuni]ECQ7056137.1 hypothetical protein [Campylobacter jejuni]EDP4420372.1 hypothetical protein [Campylobacter jejuni]HED5435399.1 hypothetical protein [Campylobacter jejuni]HEF6348202.1 hypothetical protein [Campylobacter jejuni]
MSGISINGTHKLVISGSFDRNYAILPSVNSGSNNSNNGNNGNNGNDGNDGNDSGGINNGSNNNPNDIIDNKNLTLL